jgi:hypothetical protein
MNLAQVVINQFGRKIKNRRDCEELSLQIQLTTSQLLSYNTIRRFFHLDKNNYKTRRQTVDILSQYVGYKNYADFFNHYSFQNNWSIKNQFYDELKLLNPDSIIILLKKSWNANKETFTHQMIEVSRECFRENKIHFFLSILDELTFHISNLPYSNQLLIAQGTLVYLRNINLEKVDCFSLANNKNFQNLFISNFVDIPYLKKGYYAEFINSAIHFYTDESFEFYLCLFALHKILNNIPLHDQTIPALTKSQHPILKGRIISILYWASKNNINYTSHVDLHEMIQSNYHDTILLELNTFGILLKDYHLLENLIKYNIGDFTEEYRLMHNEIHNLSKCMVYSSKNNTKLARKTYDKIQPSNVSLSHKCLFDENIPLLKEYLGLTGTT